MSPTEKERKHTFVQVQIEYGFDCFQVRFGLVTSTIWSGSEYGFVILLDESAFESHTQNSTRTAPYVRFPSICACPLACQLSCLPAQAAHVESPSGAPGQAKPQAASASQTSALLFERV